MDVINENEAAFNEPSFTRDFAEGFMGAPKSNLKAMSAWTGYAGLQATKYEKLFRYTSKTSSTWASKAGALKGAKVAAIGGKFLGVGGVILSAYEDYESNGKIGVGTGVKVAIGVATTFAYGAFGPVALGYTIVDLAVGSSTGTTLTDRIAAGIENTVIGQ
ncbi:MAG: hypothetical protein BGO86_01305 [Chryseobacterium sp. 36-9]|nr:MAG: hypothetical protein BGO86_01305 [Chryseobacterium sp. 36-9]